jgi:hypothetical protein
MSCPTDIFPLENRHSCSFFPLGLGVLVVLHSENEPHTSSHHIASLPLMDSQSYCFGYIRCTSASSLTLHFIQHQFPICKYILHSSTWYRNPPMGPPPFISQLLQTCAPSRPSHTSLGHPFLYVYYQPNYSLFIW